jgi:hypothetical protein
MVLVSMVQEFLRIEETTIAQVLFHGLIVHDV